LRRALTAGFACVLAGAYLFTNAVEWAGSRLGLGIGAVGTLLAGVSMAIPESAIRCSPSSGTIPRRTRSRSRRSSGPPFMLATLALALVGLTALGYARRREQGRALDVHRPTVRRDLLLLPRRVHRGGRAWSRAITGAICRRGAALLDCVRPLCAHDGAAGRADAAGARARALAHRHNETRSAGQLNDRRAVPFRARADRRGVLTSWSSSCSRSRTSSTYRRSSLRFSSPRSPPSSPRRQTASLGCAMGRTPSLSETLPGRWSFSRRSRSPWALRSRTGSWTASRSSLARSRLPEASSPIAPVLETTEQAIRPPATDGERPVRPLATPRSGRDLAFVPPRNVARLPAARSLATFSLKVRGISAPTST
jgi:hypothetical protein